MSVSVHERARACTSMHATDDSSALQKYKDKQIVCVLGKDCEELLTFSFYSLSLSFVNIMHRMVLIGVRCIFNHMLEGV